MIDRPDGPTVTSASLDSQIPATEQRGVELERQEAASLDSLAASAASIRRSVTVSVWAFLWLPLIGAAAVAVVRLVGAYRERRLQ